MTHSHHVIRLLFPLLILSLSMLVGCKESLTPRQARNTVELIEQAGPIETPSVVEVEEDTLDMDFDFTSNWSCYDITVDASGAAGDYRTFDANSDVIWPGNLLQGNTLDQATPSPIVAERLGGVFTINLVNGSELTSVEVEEVSQASVIGAINDIVAGNNGVLPANFSYKEAQVRSREELALRLGVSVNTLTQGISSELAINTSEEYSSFLVDFVQQYYTISYETPTSLEEVFARGTRARELEEYIGPNNPPVFIKSVTYGRRFYLLIESTESVQDIQASISASYDAAVASTEIGIGARYVNELSNVNISVFAMGGDATQAAAAFRGDLQALQTFLKEGGNIRTGAPLSYKMLALESPNQQVGVRVATQYTVQECAPVYETTPPAFTHAWYGVFGEEGIGAATTLDPDGDDVLLFNKAGTRYAQVLGNEVQAIYDLDDPLGRLAGCPFDTIGVAHGFGETIYVMDKAGKRYVSQGSDGIWGQIVPLEKWGIDNTHPFLDDGVGAGAYFSSNGPVTVHFNKAGNRYAIYDANGGGEFGPVFTLEDWGGAAYDIPFPNIGVALFIRSDDKVFPDLDPEVAETEPFFVLFNAEGTQYSIYHSRHGFTDVFDLALRP